jgi:hypothetical protein
MGQEVDALAFEPDGSELETPKGTPTGRHRTT